jgi:hypothetical protein
MDSTTHNEETTRHVEIRLAKRQSEEEPEYAETPGEEGEW